MKAKDLKPNTIYRVRATRNGITPVGFDKFVLTGDEIVSVATDNPYGYGRDRSTKRYVDVYPIEWHRDAGQYVAATDTKQIAFKDIDGDYGEQGAMGDITAEELERRASNKQRANDELAKREVNKTRWAEIDTATFDLLSVKEWDRPGEEYGAAEMGVGTVEVRLSLDAIEKINAIGITL